jgi:NADH dehydrogenase
MEEALHRSGLSFVVLRPSLIVGRAVGHRDSKMVRRYVQLIEEKKKVPLVLGGGNLVQPIFIGDLARAICTALEDSTWDGQTLDLGGGEVMTTRDFVRRLMGALGVDKPMVSIPGPVAWCAAAVMQTIQEQPLLSLDQLRIARIDGNCEHNALTEAFSIEPQALDEVLAVYREKS